jgi:hypothetical protein
MRLINSAFANTKAYRYKFTKIQTKNKTAELHGVVRLINRRRRLGAAGVEGLLGTDIIKS